MEWITKKIIKSLINRWLESILDLSCSNEGENNSDKTAPFFELKNVKIRKDIINHLPSFVDGPLPIEIAEGEIELVSLKLPRKNILSEPIIVNIQGIYVLLTSNGERLTRQRVQDHRRRILKSLFPRAVSSESFLQDASIVGHLSRKFWNNLQLNVNDVHIRFEDNCCFTRSPLAIGIVLKKVSVDSTNIKWKKISPGDSTDTMSKVVEVSRFSFYVNPNSDPNCLVQQYTNSDQWNQILKEGVINHAIGNHRFDFVISPLRCKVKIRHHFLPAVRVPGLLLDAVVKDPVNISVDNRQVSALLHLHEALFDHMARRKSCHTNSAGVGWKNAISHVLECSVRCWSWPRIKAFRSRYKAYVECYKSILVKEKCSIADEDELEILEDNFYLETIIAARAEARLQLLREDPNKLKPVVRLKENCCWFWWGIFGSTKQPPFPIDDYPEAFDVETIKDFGPTFLSSFSPEERALLTKEADPSTQSNSSSVIENEIDQKLYFSLKEINLSLKGNDKQEILFCVATGLVLSLENRFGSLYQKVSFKMESMHMEGANDEGDLVLLLKLIEDVPTPGYGVAFSCDFELNPLNKCADYGITLKMDLLELVYEFEALKKIVHFFEMNEIVCSKIQIQNRIGYFLSLSKVFWRKILSRKLTLLFDIEMKSPYLVLPEYGSIQKGGFVLILDLGTLRISNEIPEILTNLEDLTLLELEDLLFDQMFVTLSRLQVLFADSGDEWRACRLREDSELHLISTVKVKFNFFNKIYAQLKDRPKYKVNFHFAPQVVNLSDNKVKHLTEFYHRFSRLRYEDFPRKLSLPNNENKYRYIFTSDLKSLKNLLYQRVHLEAGISQNTRGEKKLPSELLRRLKSLQSFDSISQTSLEVARYFPDESDDEESSFETGKKYDTLLGYDENTSPNNKIQAIARIYIDEITVQYSRSTKQGERPFLMGSVKRISLDAAKLDYGSAVQLTLGSVHLVDKFHHSDSGEYLEFVYSGKDENMLTLFYRKVLADCPDFKTHFMSCEQSFIVDFSTVFVVLNTNSFLTLSSFFSEHAAVPFDRITRGTMDYIFYFKCLFVQYFSKPHSAPVPSGAIKCSLNFKISHISIRLSDNEIDYFNFHIESFHFGCVDKANDKFVINVYLANIKLEDFSDASLYSNIIESEDDNVLELKITKFNDVFVDFINSNKGNMLSKPNTFISLQIGRIQCVLLYKILYDLQRLFDILVPGTLRRLTLRYFPLDYFSSKLQKLMKEKTSLSVRMNTPTLIIPVKSDSPNVIICCMGAFKIDNLLKTDGSPTGSKGVRENILIEAGPIEICRGTSTLSGSLDSKEPILQPLVIRIDIKRPLMCYSREVLRWSVRVNIETMHLNVSQQDLFVILSILDQNKAEVFYCDFEEERNKRNFLNIEESVDNYQDDGMLHLQAFLVPSVDIYRTSVIAIYLEGVKFTLFTDMNEALSSPVRDAGTALCKTEIGECDLVADVNNDDSVDLKLVVKTIDIFDVRIASTNSRNIILSQILTEERLCDREGFTLKHPPLFDVTVRLSPECHLDVEMQLDKTRLHLSVDFIRAIYSYFINALPKFISDSESSSFSHGSNDQLNDFINGQTENDDRVSEENHLSEDKTSQMTSINRRIVSISFISKELEILIYVDSNLEENMSILIHTHFQIEYVRRESSSCSKLNLSKLSIVALSGPKAKFYCILKPCNIELSWQRNDCSSIENFNLQFSDVEIRICRIVTQLLCDILDEVKKLENFNFSTDHGFTPYDTENLWTPKTLKHSPLRRTYNKNLSRTPSALSFQWNRKFCLKAPKLSIVFEKVICNICYPIFLSEFAVCLEFELRTPLVLKGVIGCKLMYLNEKFFEWEYVLEPSQRTSNDLVEFKIATAPYRTDLNDTSFSSCKENKESLEANFPSGTINSTYQQESSSSSSEEEYGYNEMVILKSTVKTRPCSWKKFGRNRLNSRFAENSDSENEESLWLKISESFSHLFSSGSDVSDDEKEQSISDKDEHPRNGADDLSGSFEKIDQLDLPECKNEEYARENSSFLKCKGSENNIIIACCKEVIRFNITQSILIDATALLTECFDSEEKYDFPSQTHRKNHKFKLVNKLALNSKISLLEYPRDNQNEPYITITEASFYGTLSGSSSQNVSFDEDNENELHLDGNKGELINDDFHSINFDKVYAQLDTLPIPFYTEFLSSSQNESLVMLYENVTRYRIRIQILGFEDLDIFLGIRSQVRFYQVRHKNSSNVYHIVVCVNISRVGTEVTVRSPLQICNNLSIPVSLCYKKSTIPDRILDEMESNEGSTIATSASSVGSFATNQSDSFTSLHVLQPDQQYTLPLLIAYHSPIFILPSTMDYKMSSDGIWWREMESLAGEKILSCNSDDSECLPISFASVLHSQKQFFSKSEELASSNVPNYIINLSSLIKIFNHLPFTLEIMKLQNGAQLTLETGCCVDIINTDPYAHLELKIRVHNYKGCEWAGEIRIPAERRHIPRKAILTKADSLKTERMEIAVYSVKREGVLIYFYSDVWFINKTCLPIQIRRSKSRIVSTCSASNEILLFNLQRGFPIKKIRLRALESDWSRSFDCSAVGTCGVIICEDKQRDKKFRILAKISSLSLSAFLPNRRGESTIDTFYLTKIVTLMPYFFVRNATSKAVMYMQESDKNGLWYDIGPYQCEAFWPDTDDMYLVVRRRDSQVISKRFHFNSVHKTVLRMEKGRALVVHVDNVGSQKPVSISFERYSKGDAVVRLENCCDDHFIKFHQRGSNEVTLLPPRQSILYTWDDPSLYRVLLWNIYRSKGQDVTAVIDVDKSGEEKFVMLPQTTKESDSYLNSSKDLCDKLRKNHSTNPSSVIFTSSDSDFFETETWGRSVKYKRKKRLGRVCIYWICFKEQTQRVLRFSQSKELALYRSIPDQEIKFEVFSSLESVEISLISKYAKEIANVCILPSVAKWEIEIDESWKEIRCIELASWLEDQYLSGTTAMVKLTESLAVDYRRMQMTAPFCSRLRRSKHPAVWFHCQYFKNIKYYCCRVDSIQVDNQMRNSLYPNALITRKTNTRSKPFLDICVLAHSNDDAAISTFKHVDCIVDDLEVNVERNLILAVYDFIKPVLKPRPFDAKSLVKKITSPLNLSILKERDTSSSQPIIERFCFGGLSLNISGNLMEVLRDGSHSEFPDVVECFLSTLGIQISEIKKTRISFSQLEMSNMDWMTITLFLMDHLRYQLFSQLYVLVVGFDVVGNPYTKFRNLFQGVEHLIYDSERSTITRPAPFNSLIVKDCCRLCEYFIDLADEFQVFSRGKEPGKKEFCFNNRKRDESIDRPKRELSEMPTSYSPVMLAWQLTGMIFDGDPLKSAHESVEHFFRGGGRDLVKLICNINYAINDPIATLIDGIKRLISLGYDATLRAHSHRLLSNIFPMKPASTYEKEGLALLQSIPKKFVYADDDIIGHICLSTGKNPKVFLGTVKCFYYLDCSAYKGGSRVIWRVPLQSLTKQPSLLENTITFQLQQDESQSHLSGAVRVLQCSDPQILARVLKFTTIAMTLRLEELPCPSS